MANGTTATGFDFSGFRAAVEAKDAAA